MPDRNGQSLQPLLPPAPTVPHYDATRSQVEAFLIAYFDTQFDTLPQNEPQAMAQKFQVNGPGLYQASEDRLRELYDLNGGPLFHHIQNSKHGRVCFFSFPVN